MKLGKVVALRPEAILSPSKDRRSVHVRRVVIPWQDGAGRHRVIETVGLLRVEAARRTPQPPSAR